MGGEYTATGATAESGLTDVLLDLCLEKGLRGAELTVEMTRLLGVASVKPLADIAFAVQEERQRVDWSGSPLATNDTIALDEH